LAGPPGSIARSSAILASSFLGFHSQNRSIQNLSREFRCRHVTRFASILPSQK
jgi:hypothetical protein